MNPQSKLLIVVGIFVFTATCFGQQPADKKCLMHFAADISAVDSILSTTSHCNKQGNSNFTLPKLEFDKENTLFDFNRDEGVWKGSYNCPAIPETVRPKKYNGRS
jgi:hypothetical protein